MILGESVKFKDIGLLIIDEEQRSGVEHKNYKSALSEGRYIDFIGYTNSKNIEYVFYQDQGYKYAGGSSGTQIPCPNLCGETQDDIIQSINRNCPWRPVSTHLTGSGESSPR